MKTFDEMLSDWFEPDKTPAQLNENALRQCQFRYLENALNWLLQLTELQSRN